MSKYLNTFYEAIDVEWPIKNIRIQLLKANNIIDPIILGMLRGGHIKKQKNTCFHGFTQKKCLGTFNKKTPRCSERKKQHEQEFNASLSSSTNAPPFFGPPKNGLSPEAPQSREGKIRNNKQILACHVINPKITDMIREPNTLGSTGSTTPRATGQVPYPPHPNSRPDFSGWSAHWFSLNKALWTDPLFLGGGDDRGGIGWPAIKICILKYIECNRMIFYMNIIVAL